MKLNESYYANLFAEKKLKNSGVRLLKKDE